VKNETESMDETGMTLDTQRGTITGSMKYAKRLCKRRGDDILSINHSRRISTTGTELSEQKMTNEIISK